MTTCKKKKKKKVQVTYRKMGEKKETEQRTNNLPDLSPNISLITVNVNCLNTPQKPQIRSR